MNYQLKRQDKHSMGAKHRSQYSQVKISIIIPTFSSEKTLKRAIDSIINQTYQSWEVWVVDSCSTDGTIDIVEKYALADHRIQYVSEPDEGIYDAMNKGIRLAKGEWLYFIGSDDWLVNEEVFSTLFSIRNVDEYTVISGQVLYKGSIIGRKPKAELMLNGYPHQAAFFKKDLFIKYSYDLQYSILADQALFMQVYSENKRSWYYIDCVIAVYSAGGMSTNSDKRFLKSLERLAKLYLHDELKGKRLYRALRKRALENIKHGSVLLGLKWLMLSGVDFSYFRDALYCLRFRALQVVKIAL